MVAQTKTRLEEGTKEREIMTEQIKGLRKDK